RRLAGDTLLVEGIYQRKRIRLSRTDTLKQHIERWGSVGMAHGFRLHRARCVTSSVQPSAVRAFADRPCATRFPAGNPSTRWPKVFLSDSTGQSIAPTR